MSKKTPPYTISQDGKVTFEDGVTYRKVNHSSDAASPEEMWAILTNANGQPASPGDLAAASGRKVDLGTIDHRG